MGGQARIRVTPSGQVIVDEIGTTGGVGIHEIKVFEDTVPVVVKNDAFIWEIPEDLDGAVLIKAAGFITTAGGGDCEVAIRLGAAGAAGTDILTDKIVIQAGEYGSITAATPPNVIADTSSY
jgi:hypothetical protein